MLSRNLAARLFIRIQQQRHRSRQLALHLPHRRHRLQRHHHTRLHIQHARPQQPHSVFRLHLAPRHRRERPHRPNRIQMSQHQHRPLLARRSKPDLQHIAKLAVPRTACTARMTHHRCAHLRSPLHHKVVCPVHRRTVVARRLHLNQLAQPPPQPPLARTNRLHHLSHLHPPDSIPLAAAPSCKSSCPSSPFPANPSTNIRKHQQIAGRAGNHQTYGVVN